MPKKKSLVRWRWRWRWHVCTDLPPHRAGARVCTHMQPGLAPNAADIEAPSSGEDEDVLKSPAMKVVLSCLAVATVVMAIFLGIAAKRRRTQKETCIPIDFSILDGRGLHPVHYAVVKGDPVGVHELVTIPVEQEYAAFGVFPATATLLTTFYYLIIIF